MDDYYKHMDKDDAVEIIESYISMAQDMNDIEKTAIELALEAFKAHPNLLERISNLRDYNLRYFCMLDKITHEYKVWREKINVELPPDILHSESVITDEINRIKILKNIDINTTLDFV